MQRRAAEESLTDHGKDNSNGRAHVGDAIRHKPGILGFLRQIGFMGATAVESMRWWLVSTELHQPIRQTPEQQFIETLFDKQTAIVAQGFLTEIASVRFAAHVQGIVPRHIEGQGLDGLCIAQIVQLLQKQDPDDNV